MKIRIQGFENEIVFDDEPTLEDSSKDGGAITETYETPTIKENKGKKS